MKKLKIEILSPEGLVFSGEGNHVRAPGSNGDFGVLPDHAPFFTSLKLGRISIDLDGSKTVLSVSGGYAEVLDNKISILAESSELQENIDLERAKLARDRAYERLNSGDTSIDIERARFSLMRALNRLSIVNH
ncbi:MAG: F0F1 ATP synthase subunit epsilon [Candidatus Delongbacteria bacterium]|nr:F0F1 ATP synthase subunit epsilon [Candidatus Delongbacteria bacterium]MBN2836603.1 F0F1 ATP synthase subunit epsilon [Candidatus Delongbacteria bacterium]